MAAGLAGDIKIGLDLETKSAEQNLSSLKKTLQNSFGKTDSKSLDASIRQTEQTIKRLEVQVEKTKQKLIELNNSTVQSKSIGNMEKELATAEQQLQKLNVEFEKLAQEQEALAAHTPEGLTAEQALTPEQLARFQELDNLIIKNGQDTDALTAKIAELQAKLNAVRANPELTEEGQRYTAELQKATSELDRQKQSLNELKSAQAGVNTQFANSIPLLSGVETALGRIQGLIKRVFLFSVISRGLNSVRKIISDAVMSNEMFRASLNNLESAFWTAFAPIANYVIPILSTFINIIAVCIEAVARLIAFLTGKSYSAMVSMGKALKAQSDAYGASAGSAGKSAKKTKKAEKDKKKAIEDTTQAAKKQLAAFDDLIILTENADKTPDVEEPEIDEPDVGGAGGGGGGGGGLGDILSVAASDLTLKLRDILFNWDNLSAEDIMKKVFLGLNTLAGAVVGFGLGGVPGAILGALVGTTIGLNLVDVLFNDDDKLSKEEIAKSIGALLFSLLGAYIGFKFNGIQGAALGFEAGAVISLLLSKALFNNDGKLNGTEIANSIGSVVLTALGAAIGYLAFGIQGAALGFTLGAIVTLSIAELYANKGSLNAQQFAMGLGGIIGGVLGALVGGSFAGIQGAALGFTIGATIGVIIQALSVDGEGNLTSIGEKIYGYLKVGFASAGMLIDAVTNGGLSTLMNVGAAIHLVIEILTAEEAAEQRAREIGKKIAQDIDNGLVEGLSLTPDKKIVIGEYEDRFLSGMSLKSKTSEKGKEAGDATVESYGIGFNQTTPLLDYQHLEPDASKLKADGEEAGKETVNGFQLGVEGSPFTLTTWIQTLIDGFKQLLGIHSPSTLFEGFGADIIQGLVNGLESLGNVLVEWFQGRWNDIQGVFKDVPTKFYTWFNGGWSKIKGVFSQSAVSSWFKSRWSNIQSVFQTDVATKFNTWFSNGWTKVKGVFSQNNLSTWFTSRWKDITDIFGDNSTGVENKFSDWFSKGLSSTKKAITGADSEDGGTWKSWFQGRWDDVTGIFGESTTGVENQFSEWFKKARDNVEGKLGGSGADTWQSWFQSRWDDVTGIFGSKTDGVEKKFGDWFSDAWGAVKNVFNGSGGKQSFSQFFGGLWEEAKTTFTQFGEKLSEALGDAFKSGMNSVITLIENTINKAVNLINGAIDLINAIPGVSVRHVDQVTLPRLAKGAVLPPNKPFLAMVGDQKQGTNIEAPLTTIEQAVENVLKRGDYTSQNQVIKEEHYYLNQTELMTLLYKLTKGGERLQGNSLVEQGI